MKVIGKTQVFAEELQGKLIVIYIELEPGQDGFHYPLQIALEEEISFIKKNGKLGSAFLASSSNSKVVVMNKDPASGSAYAGSVFPRKVFVCLCHNHDVSGTAEELVKKIVKVSFHFVFVMTF